MPKDEWGDFQTPIELADQVLATLAPRGWTRILEPTCGRGSFLRAAEGFGDTTERVGIEIQPTYAEEARTSGAHVLHRNIFELNLASDVPWSTDGPLLVVGNPPWVTNADLGSITSINLPPKSNLRNLRGIDALTGASNFDIAEFIWLKLAIELASERPTIALLCKTQVARNALEYAHRTGLALARPSIRRIDARKWFGASVDACLFTATVAEKPDWIVPEFPTLAAEIADRKLGFVAGRLVADVDSHHRSAFADGSCPLEWRQGVKHDAAAVMELRTLSETEFTTRSSDVVSLELERVFPLLKATDVHHGRLDTNRRVIVTQHALAEDTSHLAIKAPKLWAYLESNASVLDNRKSSIYLGRPRFSMFGIGEYTFSPWKVAVSGLHAHANFQLVPPVEGRPVILDDTCYLLPLEDGPSAAVATALLRSAVTADLLRALTFADSKRPITKRLLQRIDLEAVATRYEPDELIGAAAEILGAPVSRADLDRFTETHLASGRLRLSA